MFSFRIQKSEIRTEKAFDRYFKTAKESSKRLESRRLSESAVGQVGEDEFSGGDGKKSGARSSDRRTKALLSFCYLS